MHLRKSVVTIAAVVAAGLLALSGTANAATGSVTGYFKSGNATFAGSTYGCSSGSIAGTYDTVNNPALLFSSLNLSCSAPYFGTATISLNSCTVPVYLSTRTSGTDTAVPGSAAFGTGTCVKVSAAGGLCTANVHGTINVSANETIKTVNGVQYIELTLTGSGTLANQAGCLGLLTGSFTLNSVVFNITPPLNFV